MKNKFVLVAFVLLILLGVFLIYDKGSDKVTLDEVRLKDVDEDNGMFAIMVQEEFESENYILYDQDIWPTKGYIFNETKSGCLDSDGKKISDVQLNYEEGKVKVETGNTSYCYIYFDKEDPGAQGKKLATEKFGSVPRGFSPIPVADLYRFVGTASNQPNNYICFGTTTKNDCTNITSNYLYRIIGITAEGNLKIIKNSSIQTNSWHSGYAGSENNAVWDIANNDKKESELHNNLNGSAFLTNSSTQYVPNGWESKIVTTSWSIGDSKTVSGAEGDGIGYGTGKTQTGSQVWTWENASNASTASKIGLMYLSDYYYSLDGSGNLDCYTTSGKEEYKTCKTSWLHISNNGDSSTTSINEWTMSRYGQGNTGNYAAWYVLSNGSVNIHILDGIYVVRPVFYLDSNVTITSGDGSSGNPYMIN